jgi:hypothetical protein
VQFYHDAKIHKIFAMQVNSLSEAYRGSKGFTLRTQSENAKKSDLSFVLHGGFTLRSQCEILKLFEKLAVINSREIRQLFIPDKLDSKRDDVRIQTVTPGIMTVSDIEVLEPKLTDF